MSVSKINQVLFVILVLSLIAVAFIVGRLTTEKQLADTKAREETAARKDAIDRSFSDITERATTMPAGTTLLKYCLRGKLDGNFFYGQVLFKLDNSKARPIVENSWLIIENSSAVKKYTLPMQQIFSFPRASKTGLRTVIDFGQKDVNDTGDQFGKIRASIPQETADNPAGHLRVSSRDTSNNEGSYQIKGAEEECE